jgi:hypothetical protein
MSSRRAVDDGYFRGLASNSPAVSVKKHGTGVGLFAKGLLGEGSVVFRDTPLSAVREDGEKLLVCRSCFRFLGNLRSRNRSRKLQFPKKRRSHSKYPKFIPGIIQQLPLYRKFRLSLKYSQHGQSSADIVFRAHRIWCRSRSTSRDFF